MPPPRNFAYVTAADLLARSAYQMGKTPLLPIFAASLGATGTLLGFIVSVSTLSGMVLKPFIGIFSDRWGRRGWLIAGTLFFAVMPFLYRFVYTPEQLLAISARKSVKMTQKEFARLLNVSVDSIQDWEQGRRSPRGAAKTLLRVAQDHPEVLEELAT